MNILPVVFAALVGSKTVIKKLNDLSNISEHTYHLGLIIPDNRARVPKN